MQNRTYKGLTFPDYVFREFPKMVNGRIAKDAAEEEALLLEDLEKEDHANKSGAPHSKRSNPLRS